jgi:hypothetical protein
MGGLSNKQRHIAPRRGGVDGQGLLSAYEHQSASPLRPLPSKKAFSVASELAKLLAPAQADQTQSA